MLPRDYGERARRLLHAPGEHSVVAPRAFLLWRTHDYGLLELEAARADEVLLRALRRALAVSRRAAERVALPVELLYCLGKEQLRVSRHLEEDGGLPGKGCVTRIAGTLVCASREPEACQARLAELEHAARETVMAALIGAPPAAGGHLARPFEAGQLPVEESCGACREGLLGDCQCLGGACVNHGRTRA